MSDNVHRVLNNFAVMPSYNTVLTKDEVNEILDTTGGWTLCNGDIREYVFEKITEERFKASTKRKEYA